MEDVRNIAKNGLNSLLKAGAYKAQCRSTLVDKHEMNLELSEITLLRTTFDTSVSLMAIRDHKKGASSINKSDVASLEQAAQEVLAIADASAPDEAYDIAEYQPPEEFSAGYDSPDLDKMHLRIKEFLGEVESRYPQVRIMQSYVDFTHQKECFVNSNGVDFVSSNGVYHCVFVFSSKEGNKVSSFNYTGCSLRDLENRFLDSAFLDTLLTQSVEHIYAKPLQGKFVGDVIITPQCFQDVLYFLTESLSDSALIGGTSIYKDKLHSQVASPILTIHSRPVSDEICDGYFVTRDGYAAQNSTVIDDGILNTFFLSLYGSKKTGLKRSVNDGEAFVIEPGKAHFDDMVKSVERGVLLTRFSGGTPADSGDFSGVAKNSYLIENGKISYPITEAMISGNMADLLMDVTAVSSERTDFGFSILPYVAASGVTVSGK